MQRSGGSKVFRGINVNSRRPLIPVVRGRPRSCEWKRTKQSRYRLIGVRKASLKVPSCFASDGRVGAALIPADPLRMVRELLALVGMPIIGVVA